MTLRNQRPLTFKPNTVSDAVDGTNAAPGTLYAAVNLVPSMHTRNVWVPRPAATKLFDFSAIGATGEGEALVEIGNRIWGFVQRGDGKSIPFIYDTTTNRFIDIGGLDTNLLPNSTANTGDWQPPSLAQVGAFLLWTHPGFQMPISFGWLDTTGLTSSTIGYVYEHTNVVTLASDVLLAGWRPGMYVSGPYIPAETRITAVSVDGLSITLSNQTTGGGSLWGSMIWGQAVWGPTIGTITVRGGTPDHPLWAAGNLNTYPLPGVASWVTMFNGRAWYAVKNSVAFSDAGDPLQMTNASQVLTIQNGLDITCMSTMPFANQTLQGGVTSAMMVFQADAALWQVTGDQATQNLALNLTAENGTLAPNSLATVPMAGLRFIAPDGLRQVSLNGVLSEPLSDRGDGVALPFMNTPFPSRIAAAYNEDVYRVTTSYYTTTGGAPNATLASSEYWFHEKLKAWSGPHTCPARLIAPSNQEHTGHGFIAFRMPTNQPVLGSGIAHMLGSGPVAIILLGTGGGPPQPTSVSFSVTHPMIDSSYWEDDQPLTWLMQTSLLPDTGDMFIAAMLETAVLLAMPPGETVSISALDERGATISNASMQGFFPPSTGPTEVWSASAVPNALIWGTGTWGVDPGGTIPAQRQVDWRATLVFKQTSIVLHGVSSSRIAVGNVYLRYQRSGYMMIDPARVQQLPPGIPNFAA